MNFISRTWRQIRGYPSAIIGLVLIAILIVVSIATPLILPYSEAIRLWRGGEDIWRVSPRTAAPAWLNWFTDKDQPATIVFDSKFGRASLPPSAAARFASIRTIVCSDAWKGKRALKACGLARASLTILSKRGYRY
jgi:hypothetical protein